MVSSFSWTEKLVPGLRDRDERSLTGILNWGLNLAPAFPACDQWLWEFVARYSGATVPDSHRVPRHSTAMTDGRGVHRFFKERPSLKTGSMLCQVEKCRLLRQGCISRYPGVVFESMKGGGGV